MPDTKAKKKKKKKKLEFTAKELAGIKTRDEMLAAGGSVEPELVTPPIETTPPATDEAAVKDAESAKAATARSAEATAQELAPEPVFDEDLQPSVLSSGFRFAEGRALTEVPIAEAAIRQHRRDITAGRITAAPSIEEIQDLAPTFTELVPTEVEKVLQESRTQQVAQPVGTPERQMLDFILGTSPQTETGEDRRFFKMPVADDKGTEYDPKTVIGEMKAKYPPDKTANIARGVGVIYMDDEDEAPLLYREPDAQYNHRLRAALQQESEDAADEIRALEQAKVDQAVAQTQEGHQARWHAFRLARAEIDKLKLQATKAGELEQKTIQGIKKGLVGHPGADVEDRNGKWSLVGAVPHKALKDWADRQVIIANTNRQLQSSFTAQAESGQERIEVGETGLGREMNVARSAEALQRAQADALADEKIRVAKTRKLEENRTAAAVRITGLQGMRARAIEEAKARVRLRLEPKYRKMREENEAKPEEEQVDIRRTIKADIDEEARNDPELLAILGDLNPRIQEAEKAYQALYGVRLAEPSVQVGLPSEVQTWLDDHPEQARPEIIAALRRAFSSPMGQTLLATAPPTDADIKAIIRGFLKARAR